MPPLPEKTFRAALQFFAAGFGSALAGRAASQTLEARRSAESALSKDWHAVGRDLEKAFEAFASGEVEEDVTPDDEASPESADASR
jgi:hypothetical protein